MVHGVEGVLGDHTRALPLRTHPFGPGRGLWAYLIFLEEICLIFFRNRLRWSFVNYSLLNVVFLIFLLCLECYLILVWSSALFYAILMALEQLYFPL